MEKVDYSKLREPLQLKDVDFRVQSINKGGYATILAYKDARVDMNRLDDVVGAGYWKREHFDNNTRCRVSIYNTDIKEWICKEDVGTPSNTEAQKGLASDSFKRACFNLGIGRELYDYPVISVKLNTDEFEITNGRAKATYNLKVKDWVWKKEKNADGSIYLECSYNNIVRYQSNKKEVTPPLVPTKQTLTEAGFNFLSSPKATKEQVQEGLKDRQMTDTQRKVLTALIS